VGRLILREYIPNPQRPKEAAQALRLALHHGVNPKDIVLWSLFRASGNAELLRVFLEAGANANVNDDGCTLLHYLTAYPDTKRIPDRVLGKVAEWLPPRVSPIPERHQSKASDIRYGGVRAGLAGEAPRLLDLEDGDLKTTTDFRRVYATVIEDWLGLPAQATLGGQFNKLPLLRT
jgi:hypothetical protein